MIQRWSTSAAVTLIISIFALPVSAWGPPRVAPVAAAPAAAPPPFERTEVRQPCSNYVATKQPLFGELHLHTAYSFDAVTLDTRNTPADAYRYAKGERVGIPPWANTGAGPTPPDVPSAVGSYPYCMPGQSCPFTATRTLQLPEGRALDFAAITDHSEQFGEVNTCEFNGTETCCTDASTCTTIKNCTLLSQECFSGFCRPIGYDSATCLLARDEASRLRGGILPTIVAGFENTPEAVSRPPFCGPDGSLCLVQAKHVWDKIRADAEMAYDRTSACTFTSLIAYEYTAMAADGKCEGTGLPCWDELGQPTPSNDCPTGQKCLQNFAGSGGAENLHRNIIFRNDDVLDLPISNVERPLGCGFSDGCTMPPSGTTTTPNSPIASPEVMLRELKAECIDNPLKPRCDVLSIPHNSNLSRGSMFIIPETIDEAEIRNEMEPLVEIMQIKGGSECRFSALHPGAWDNVDELCNFENMSYSVINGDFIPKAQQDADSIPPRSYVRNTLRNGIQYAADNGVNPFQLGFVGALDNHQGTPGQSDAEQYAKSGAHGVQSFVVSAEALNEKLFLGLETNAGGITGVWAEENSRDSIFTALKRRETFATSGTRPVVRFFGGFNLPATMCQGGSFAERGYLYGVPMGGCLEKNPAPGSDCKGMTSPVPRFAVTALKDPGWPGHPGTNLQRVQIIKGWVDKQTGMTREAVYDIAGIRNNGASVDLKTCTPRGDTYRDLCAVWSDPHFDPDEHAFYYARVLENPSCRWNQFYCNARGVDCSKPMGVCRSKNWSANGRGCNSNADCAGGVCTLPATYEEYEYRQCCGNIVPKTVQQRAWTSPIWYTPS